MTYNFNMKETVEAAPYRKSWQTPRRRKTAINMTVEACRDAHSV